MKVKEPKIRTVTFTIEECTALENAVDILEELSSLVKAQEVVEAGDEFYSESFVNDCVCFLLDVINCHDTGIIIHPDESNGLTIQK